MFWTGDLPAGAASRVDVLDGATGATLLSNVVDGQSLAGIDPAQHPALRLQATLSRGFDTGRPVLDRWQVTWFNPTPTSTRTPTRTPTPTPTSVPLVFSLERDYPWLVYYGANLTPPLPAQVLRGCYVGPPPPGGRAIAIEVYDAAGHTAWWNVLTDGAGRFVLGPAGTGDINFGATETGAWSATAYISVAGTIHQVGPVYWEVRWFPVHEIP